MAACGGHSQRPLSPYPAKINLIPANQSSVQLGSTFNFSASAQNANGTNVNTTFTFTSSDTTVLNIAPNGVGCAGRWDAAQAAWNMRMISTTPPT